MAPVPMDFEAATEVLDVLSRRFLPQTPPAPATLEKRLPSPTKTIDLLGNIWRRQSTTTQVTTTPDCSLIPTCYGGIRGGPSGGTVVGIVLGSVGGFLLLLWLLYTCLNFNRGGGGAASSYAPTVTSRARSSRRAKSTARSQSRRSRRSFTETAEIRRSSSPARYSAPQPPMAVPMPMPMPGPPPQQYRDREVIEERRSVRGSVRGRDEGEGSDEVVVIEEHESSPPRRSKSKSKRSSKDGAYDSGYRTVDPDSYGGVVGGGKRDRRR